MSATEHSWNNTEQNLQQQQPKQDTNKASLDQDQPITGPKPVGPEYIWEPDLERPESIPLRFSRFIADLARKPAHYIRENIVEPNRGPKYYWYHRKYKRALPIDECYIDDYACVYEADLEFKRTRLVDKATLDILRGRRDSCWFWNVTTEGIDQPSDNCREIVDTYNREEINFHVKYGDLTFNHPVIYAYNKQKHRLIMERRRAKLNGSTTN